MHCRHGHLKRPQEYLRWGPSTIRKNSAGTYSLQCLFKPFSENLSCVPENLHLVVLLVCLILADCNLFFSDFGNEIRFQGNPAIILEGCLVVYNNNLLSNSPGTIVIRLLVHLCHQPYKPLTYPPSEKEVLSSN